MESDRIKEMANLTMEMAIKYVDEMMEKLITEISESKIQAFSKEEVIAILKVHSFESQNRLRSTISHT